ncbi:two-component system, NtrC family, sensor kinase [Desulfuromusa kysingii]|uniref:histidine kinase n=1 Tax=Desulfuromusa kysingii TaxID=37625 RepID=A0A1H3VK45_9BACT|nr:ATP-binding protein [Desulfuromusa kysingii]SDZ75140.1 two-component system, NtrC family, sensor kinase [Desulfuromusa kysingii]
MRIRLALRYTAISSLILLVVMSISAYLHIEKVQKVFAQWTVQEAGELSEMIVRDSHHLMLADNNEQLQLMIEDIGRNPRIKRARILGKEGVVVFSMNKHEIGTTLGENDESCSFCHLTGSKVLVDVPIEERSRTFSDENGTQYLSITRGIYNEPSCYTAACHAHSADEKKIGVLDMVVSQGPMVDLAHSHHKDVIVSTMVMLIILSLCHYFLTRKHICDPIQGLLVQTQALSAGDLTARVKHLSGDEIGELGESFNVMADNLAQAQIELKEWGYTLEHKVEMRTAEITDMQGQLLRSAKLASMGELVAGVAHEINNPLTGILMFASLSSKTPDLPQQVKENLELIVAETGRCAKIVRGLLEFARESFPEKNPDSINRIIEHTLELVSHQIIFQDVDIRYQGEDGLPDLEVDTDQLQQVFLNMLINAGQAMPSGGTLKITTKLLEKSHEVEIIIEDTGAGISQENLDKIFDPFFSTKAQKGFGLGLSVSYGIINNHGGHVDVKSREGEGTRFSIYLPVAQTVSLEEPDNGEPSEES